MQTPGPWQLRVNGMFLRVVHGDHKTTVADGIVSEANAKLIVAAPELLTDGQFLADRLDEFAHELIDDEVARQFFGHVSPALARFRATLSKATL